MDDARAASKVDNKPLLRELRAAKAFGVYEKTKPIRAKRLHEDQQVPTREGTVVGKAGHFLCEGANGERWPQEEEKLLGKYSPQGQPDPQGWQTYTPKPGEAKVYAAPVPKPFQVQAPWGLLQGKPGDYVVYSLAEGADNPDPSDVWIVGQRLFQATYERIG